MKRLFWVAVGAGVGVYAARRLSRARAAVAPTALGGQVAAARDGARSAVGSFVADVRAGMAEREEELRAQLGLAADLMAVPPPPGPSRPPVPPAGHRRHRGGTR